MFRHITRCVVAGFVALLPLLAAAVSLFFVEAQLSSSWLAKQQYYVPGLGIVFALILIYAVGLFVTTFAGRWLWRRVDRLIERMPVVGKIYQSLKQVLGYDTEHEKFFHQVVLVRTHGGQEIGLVTSTSHDAAGRELAVVFVPGSPNPAYGRLLFVPKQELEPVATPVSHALRTLVAIGKTPLVDAPK